MPSSWNWASPWAKATRSVWSRDKQCCEKWKDFCPRYVRMSRGEADRIIPHLEEFGPAYFELSRVIRISAETFRAIAPALSDGVLHHNGEAIPLNAENSHSVAAAVTEMRSALPKRSAAQSSRANSPPDLAMTRPGRIRVPLRRSLMGRARLSSGGRQYGDRLVRQGELEFPCNTSAIS